MPSRLIAFIEILRRTGVQQKASMRLFYYHQSDSFLERLAANVVINLIFLQHYWEAFSYGYLFFLPQISRGLLNQGMQMVLSKKVQSTG